MSKRFGAHDGAVEAVRAEMHQSFLKPDSFEVKENAINHPLVIKAVNDGVLFSGSLEDPVRYSSDEFIVTASGNKVSRKTQLFGSQNITMAGKSVLLEGVMLRGDLAPMRFGRYVWLGAQTVLQPCSCRNKGEIEFVPLSVGEFVMIGSGCVIRAAAIGSNVQIGDNCVVGNRVLIKDCCKILPDSVLPPDTIVPAFTVFGGKPAKFICELSESQEIMISVAAKDKYKLFISENIFSQS